MRGLQMTGTQRIGIYFRYSNTPAAHARARAARWCSRETSARPGGANPNGPGDAVLPSSLVLRAVPARRCGMLRRVAGGRASVRACPCEKPSMISGAGGGARVVPLRSQMREILALTQTREFSDPSTLYSILPHPYHPASAPIGDRNMSISSILRRPHGITALRRIDVKNGVNGNRKSPIIPGITTTRAQGHRRGHRRQPAGASAQPQAGPGQNH